MNGHNAVARRWSRSSGQPGSWPAASCWSKPISWPTVTSHLQPPVPRGDPSSPPSMAPAALRARVAGVLVCSSWCPDAITGVDAVPAPTSSAFPSMPFPPPRSFWPAGRGADVPFALALVHVLTRAPRPLAQPA